MFESVMTVIVTFGLMAMSFIGGVYYAVGKKGSPREILHRFFIG